MGGVFSAGKYGKAGGKKNSEFSGKLKSSRIFGKGEENSHSYTDADNCSKSTPHKQNSGELFLSFSRELKPSTPARAGAGKVNQKSSFLGKAGAMGLEKAVEVLDTLGSSMSNLNAGSGFSSSMPSRGNRISILSFEVANTIAKGANLFESLSEENVMFLKKEILQSEGVQQLVSTDMKELLSIAAADKREEFDVFSREVIRFGDLCKDPQWHNLGRYFSKLHSEYSTDKQLKADAEMIMQELTTLAQYTSELYHELHALDRFDQDYQQKHDEAESLGIPQRGESLMILQSERNEQRKLVRSLKKKSLWSKKVEEIVEKLVDIVTYLDQAILEAFGNDDVSEKPDKNPQRLGTAGLSLHYANIINQIDSIASRPTSLPANTRDNLYQGLPNSVKVALRHQLRKVDVKEELPVAQVKAEMEKTLEWLVPIADSTTKAHQGFGWVGEWANTGNEFGKNTASHDNLIRLQTLYHADKQKTDQYILELLTWLQRLMNSVRQRDRDFRIMATRSPMQHKGQFFNAERQPLLSVMQSTRSYGIQLSQEDKDLLNKVNGRKLVPGISRSQEFSKAKAGKEGNVLALNRSTSTESFLVTEIDVRQHFGHPSSNFLDVMDGLDSMS